MLDKVTKATFETIKGTTFQLALDDGGTIALELFAVRSNGLQGLASREQFALDFLGPADPALPQRTYRLDHQQLGAMEMFLVPIRRDASGMMYEAVFT
jgi:hypothetical protein